MTQRIKTTRSGKIKRITSKLLVFENNHVCTSEVFFHIRFAPGALKTFAVKA